MSIPDPVTTGVVLAGALQIAKQGQEFIAAAFGHPGESIGTILGNAAQRRIQNVEAVGNKAHLILLNIGETPQEVPLNIIQPLLEGASLQEDPTLQETWANLLANATNPRQSSPVEPSFAAMLKELSSREVHYLEHLFREVNGIPHLKLDQKALERVYGNIVKAGFADAKDFQLAIDTLERNRILVQQLIPPTIDGGDIRVEALNTKYDPGRVSVSDIESDYVFTQLGLKFVRCVPTPSSKCWNIVAG